MQILKKIFGRGSSSTNGGSEDDPIIPVAIPPLISILHHLEQEKGAPLSESEVWEARDLAVCMTMRRSMRDHLAKQRGYADVEMENAWLDWQAVRASLGALE